MKKTWFPILFLLCLLCCMLCGSALAEIYVLDPIYATVEIPEEYVVLTPANLDQYATWLSAKGLTQEAAEEDFEKRGVLLQAWDNDHDRVFELRANQTQETYTRFDINEQDTDYRGAYRTKHYPKNELPGYEFTSSDWKIQDGCRYLVLKYKRRDSGEILYKGFMRRTIRNGYEIDLDMQLWNHAPEAKDNAALNKIWESFRFVEVLDMPPAASARINFIQAPPQETKNANFAITGTASEGVTFTAVTMGLNYPDPMLATVTVGKDGKFSIPISLPKEGAFLITLTADYKDETVLEASYPVTYQHNLLAVNFTTEPEGVVKDKSVKFAGRSEPGTNIQVLVNGEKVATKRTNGEGKFSFEVELKEEENYEIGLVFIKKNLADRRFTYSIRRQYTDAENIKALKKQALSPTYAKLTGNIDKYNGKILGYKGYIVDVNESGDNVIITMALKKRNKKYSEYIVVTGTEKPNFAVGEKVWFYGTCTGLTQAGNGIENDAESTSAYPCMSLLLFADIN